MGKDSAKALELVRISKEIQKPLVEKHHGQWLKEMGDGALVKFGTALDAVNCAIEIQELARAKFDGKLRIGIHSGDITIENDDVYGDGVNIASRLESIADPGGVYISESIEKAIRGQTRVQAKSLGETRLKNVDYPVKTYALQGVGLPEPKLVSINKKRLRRRTLYSAAIIVVIGLIIVIGMAIKGFDKTEDNSVDQSVFRSSILLSLDAQIDLIGEATVGVGRRVVDISNTGDKIAYIGNYNGRPHVYIRRLDEFKAVPILQTAGAYHCVISPDGQEVGFLVGNSLKKIRTENGTPQNLAEVPNPMDISWDIKNVIYYTGSEGRSLHRFQNLPEDLESGQYIYSAIDIIPETELVIISGDRIAVYNLSSREITDLGLTGTSARYSPTGHIVYIKGASLTAVAFDVNDLKVLSDPKEILPGIRTETYGTGQFDFSPDGTLIYIPGESTVIGTLTWVDRLGNMEALPFPNENYGEFKLSPNGDKIAVSIFGTSEDLWILDMSTMNKTRITNNGKNGSPVWIDNNSLYTRKNDDIVRIQIDQPLSPEFILEDGRPQSLSMDGSKLIFFRNNPPDVYMKDTKTGIESRITNTPNFEEVHASISPDGRWIAFTSDRSKAFHVYLQESIPDGKVIQISRREGSEEPRWTSDGKHIIYRSGQQWMQVELLDAKNLQVGSPELVLEGDFVNIGGFSFDITTDGKKFLVSKGTVVKTAGEIRVVKGWFRELQDLVPSTK